MHNLELQHRNWKGVEYRSVHELQVLLGYSKWENFEKVIRKAKDACKNAGGEIAYHFPEVRKMITKGKGAKDEIDDILLTRYACYLIAQNGDSRKQEIAFAQNYSVSGLFLTLLLFRSRN